MAHVPSDYSVLRLRFVSRSVKLDPSRLAPNRFPHLIDVFWSDPLVLSHCQKQREIWQLADTVSMFYSWGIFCNLRWSKMEQWSSINSKEWALAYLR